MKKGYYPALIILLMLLIPRLVLGQSSPNRLTISLKILASKGEPKNLYHGPMRILYAKMVVRNKTAQTQEVAMMKCDWNYSWVGEGFYSICSWGCDGNYPIPVIVPAGKAVVFYAPLCHEYKSEITNPDSVVHFKLGFIAFSAAEFFPDGLSETDRLGLRKNRVVYWSNEVADNINAKPYREALNKVRYRHYYAEYRLPKRAK